MQNKAKCKLCNTIIESFHSTDYAQCECGEIAVEGGDSMRCLARDWNNFQRVDSNGNTFIPTVAKEGESNEDNQTTHVDKDELLKMVEDMIASYERLPVHALSGPASNADLLSILFLVKSICRF